MEGVFRLLLLSLMLSSAAALADFLTTFPKKIRPGLKFGLETVLLVDNDAGTSIRVDMRITASNTSAYAWQNAFKSETIPARQKTHSMEFMPPGSLKAGQVVFVHVTIGQTSTRSSMVTVDTLASTVFIETDKGIYKPGDLVLYRIVTVDNEMVPENQDVSVFIQDGDGNAVYEARDQELTYPGIYNAEFQLQMDIVYGTWQLKVETGDETASVPFVVKEYTLPRFDVTLTLTPEYVVGDYRTTKLKLDGTVKSLYTYGKNVIGDLMVSVDGKSYVSGPFNGEQSFSIDAERGQRYGAVTVVATVTEKDTGIERNVSMNVYTYQFPFKVEAVNPTPTTAPGQKYYKFFGKVSDPLGNMVSDIGNYQIRVTFRFNYQDEQGYAQNREEALTVNPNSNPFEVNAVFLEGQPKETLKNVMITVSKNDREIGQETTFYPKLYKSKSGHALQVTLYNNVKSEAVPPTEVYESLNDVFFKVTSDLQYSTLYYQVVGNYYPSQIETWSEAPEFENGVYYSVFRISRQVGPKFLLIVYANVGGKEIIAANIVVSINWSPSFTPYLAADPSTARPGKDVSFMMESLPSGFASISVIDSSVNLLAENNDITNAKIIQAITQLRLFDPPERLNPWPMPVPMFERRGAVARKKRCFGCGGFYTSEVGAMDILQASGLTAVSDLTLSQYSYYSGGGGGIALFNRGEVAQMNVAKSDAGGAVEGDAATNNKVTDDAELDADEADDAAPVRDYFPETWLWDTKQLNYQTGQASWDEQCPGTITNWTASAWVLHPQAGLGVATGITVSCFQDFFISLNLPYSIKMGEKFQLEVRVFSYNTDSDIDVSLTIERRSADFSLGSMDNYNHQLSVGPGQSTMVKLDFTALRFGTINIPVSAAGEGIQDSLSRELLVKPPGIEATDSMKDILTVDGSSSSSSFSMPATIEHYEQYVEGSGRFYIQTAADRWATVINYLLSIIKLPYGCGEQNLQSVTPAVYCGKYLKEAGNVDVENMNKITKATTSGYQRQLKYKHGNGAYSAFGEGGGMCGCGGPIMLRRPGEDAEIKPPLTPGSGWLSAYTLKTFSQVLISDLGYASREVLLETFDYLVGLQAISEHNFFFDEGRVLHAEMQGGTGKGASNGTSAYTAWVIISLQTYKELILMDEHPHTLRRRRAISSKADQVLSSACAWLKSDLTRTRYEHSYPQLIAAYALAKCEEYETARLILLENLGELDALDTKVCPMYRYYGKNDGTCDRQCETCGEGSKCCPENYQKNSCTCQKLVKQRKAGPSTVEMYAYRLLAILSLDNFDNFEQQPHDDYQWLMQRQGPTGGYVSTQDTAAAMEALSKYTSTFKEQTRVDLTIDIMRNGEKLTTVYIDENNKTALSRYQIADGQPSDTYTVTVSGTGTAIVTAIAYYNYDDAKTKGGDKISVDTDILYDAETGLGTLEVCVESKSDISSTELSAMLLAYVQLPTGFDVIGQQSTTTNQPSRLDKHDKEGLVDVYYETNDSELTRTCLNFDLEKRFSVQNRKPVRVVALDYYEPTVQAFAEYNIDETATITTTKKPCYGEICGVSAVVVSWTLVVLTAILQMLFALNKA